MRLISKRGYNIFWQRINHINPKHQQLFILKNNIWNKPNGFDTGIEIYNSIKKEKVPLILRNKNVATWYMCGPTVYDSAHIGHACCYMRLDIIKRILSEYFNINVINVMGITDIDDKIIMRSKGSSKFADWKQLAKFYEQEFYTEMNQLNILPPYLYCRVSDYIPQIINFISQIMSTGCGYTASDGSIYFDTQKYGKYGKLSNPEPPEAHPVKKCSSDFALWKAAKEGDPSWDSPWGAGRPGWHIECSAMGSFLLGKNIDLHSGGLDLLFPHHENEETQSCCCHSTEQWVNYWIHTGLLHLSDAKMSKSLNNTISIKELLEKYTPNQFRLLCLLTHYKTAVDFSDSTMHKAIAMQKKFQYFQSDCLNYITGKLSPRNIDETAIFKKLDDAERNIRRALASDFNTPRVIAELSDTVDLVNKMLNPTEELKEGKVDTSVSISAVSTFLSKHLFSLGVSETEALHQNNEKFTEVVDLFVNFRKSVRNKAISREQKDVDLLEACDDARKSLGACGVKIKDFKNTSTWTLVE